MLKIVVFKLQIVILFVKIRENPSNLLIFQLAAVTYNPDLGAWHNQGGYVNILWSDMGSGNEQGLYLSG